MSVVEATQRADLLILTLPDESMGDVYREEIAPHLRAGQALGFVHGFAIRFELIAPPPDVDVIMAAPKGPGTLVRERYQRGGGITCLVAVHQDATGQAREIALEHLRTVGEVFQATSTVWENYAPESAKQGKPATKNFVGWTGIVPIQYFIEYGIGLKADAPNNRLTWVLTSAKRCGCERFRFNGHTATLIAQPPGDPSGAVEVTVESDGQFQLLVERDGKKWDFAVKAGKNSFKLD
jgi:hypothetical protein